MAINKNFVVKHGLEVNEDLILANADNGSVGIATTNPRYLFHVNGGIGVTNAYVTGIATVQTNLVLNGSLTANASAGSTGQYLKSTATGVEWASFPALRTSISYVATASQTTFSFAYTVGLLDVYVNGVKLASPEYTASDGVSVILSTPCFGGEFIEIIGYGVTSVGAGTSGIAGLTIQEEGSITGNTGGVTSINFVGAAVTAVGSGAGVTVYISEGGASTQWLSTAAGIHTLSNVGIGTTNPTSALTVKGNTSLETLSVSGVSTLTGTAFIDQLSVSGVSTLSNVVVGGGTTELIVNGDARITGILTIGTASITIDPSTNTITTNNIIVTNGSSQPYYAEPHSVNDGLPIEIVVGVTSTKQTTHRFFGTGGNYSYLLDSQESPYLNLIVGKTYRFIQEDSSNEFRPIKFFKNIQHTEEYLDTVTTAAGVVAGEIGFYTDLFVAENTPKILYYDNDTVSVAFDGFMGNQINVIGSTVIGGGNTVSLLHSDGQIKLNTIGSGVTITGTTFTNQLSVSGFSTFQGIGRFNSSYLDVYNTSGNAGELAYLRLAGSKLVGFDGTYFNIDANADYLNIRSDSGVRIGDDSTMFSGQVYANFYPNVLEFYVGGNEKFDVIGAGVTVIGTTFTNQLSVSGVSTVGILTGATYYGNASNVVDGRWEMTGDGSDYTFTGIGITSGNNTDPVLYLARGRVYEFVNNAGGSHPFEIRESSGGSAYTAGVTGSSTGTTRFEVPMNAPNTLFYQCTIHAGMGNTISVYPSLI